MSKLTRTLAVLFAFAIGATAQASSKPAPVPPTLEIAVLDPNVDPQGRPAIKFKPERNADGKVEIDIPESVIVHRYYYTGDRSFQAQLLPGGPVVVVVNHPKCGDRLYIPVQMIPGAPRVRYTAHTIEYDFGKQGITIRFCPLTTQPKVEYRNCMTIARRFDDCKTKMNKSCKEFADRCGLTEAKQTVNSACKGVCAGTADAIGKAGKLVMMPVNAIAQRIPGAQLLKTNPEDQATSLRDAQVTAAQKAAAGQDLSIKTNK